MNEDVGILESVIQITGERDKQSLEKALLKSFMDFMNIDAVVLLCIPADSHANYVEPTISLPQFACKKYLNVYPDKFNKPRVDRDDKLNQCIEHHQIITDTTESGATYSYFPILLNDGITGVLCVFNYVHNIESENFIRGITHIYSNFLSIMHDNEHDTLTGLLNRKTFDKQLSNLQSSYEYSGHAGLFDGLGQRDFHSTEHWLGMLDIDHFKKINDNFGHVYGDEVLLLFSEIMRKVFRTSDLLFRFGGEEFVVVLLNATEAEAFSAFNRFRKELEDFHFPQVGQATVSIGMVKFDPQSHSTTLIENADKALYYAKENGRNQVCDFHELVKKGHLTTREIQSDIDLF